MYDAVIVGARCAGSPLAALDDLLSERSSEEEALGRYETAFESYAEPLLTKTLTMGSFESSSVDRATAFLELQELHAHELAELTGEPLQLLGA